MICGIVKTLDTDKIVISDKAVTGGCAPVQAALATHLLAATPP